MPRASLFLLAAVVGATLATGCSASRAPRPIDPRSAAPVPGSASNTSPPSLAHVHPDFDAGLVPFTVHFEEIDSSLGTIPAFVMPGRTLDFSVTGGSGAFDVKASAGQIASGAASSWTWRAPRVPGDQQIRIRDRRSAAHEEMTLRVFVLQPYSGGPTIGTYRIGRYADPPKERGEAYQRPEGFVQVTEANVDTPLSPHFRLGQFVCKQGEGFPKYVALRTALFVKLEGLMRALAEHGLPASTLHVMSGYRTPAYNAGIGNETTLSRHGYGDAADVFLDRDGDGVEDDLNGDGKSTREDARILYQLVEDSLEASLPPSMAGGLSAYGPTDAHGPFLHVDTRGKKARW